MPRKPINYSETHFYEIVCKDTNIKENYVGHTTDFTKRKCAHKTSCLNSNDRNHNLKLYKFIRENGGWENWQMILIDTKVCKNSLDAKRIEREFISQMKPRLNISIPTQTKKEYSQTAKSREYQKNYTLNHKQEKQEYDKTYREDNKEKKKEQGKKYREDNRHILLETIVCECGGKYAYKNRARHFQTKQHQQYLQSLQQD